MTEVPECAAVRVVCPRCAGTGVVMAERSAVELHGDRTGSGLVRRPCGTCDGELWLPGVAGFA
ncbi:hypothetical protein ABZV93_10380 [Actinopolymorpha sp. NPDC004070]|uniref:hypothetical protein n=1 Tax=Actinopolymorpha sp. NPDC004070 TaxID=3154548 RepID=UPI0033B79E9D